MTAESLGLWWRISIPNKRKPEDILKLVEELKMDKKAKTSIKVSVFALMKHIWSAGKDKTWNLIVESSYFWLCNGSKTITVDWNQ
ncbi:hypothetical protein LXL04_001674 [Taraxacum kok-saghyz]